MQSFQPTCTFHKYFPCISVAEDVPLQTEPTQDLFSPPLSISHLASRILQQDHSRDDPGFLIEFNRLISAKNIRFRAIRSSGALDHGHVQRSRSTTSHSACGKEDEEEGTSYSDEVDSGVKGKSSWKDMPKFLLAGAVSTIVSRTCIAPLERIKLECIVRGSKEPLMKIARSIWVAEGLKGFWKGNALNLFRMIPFKCVNFICYDMYLDCLLNTPGKMEITNHDRLVGGGISGVLATVLCIPLDTIRTRLIAPGGEALGGIAGCFSHMVQKEGFLSLYKGLNAALISMGPASAVFYTVYDILKTSHIADKRRSSSSSSSNSVDGSGSDRRELGIVRTLLYGAIAGACAETVTYPLEVVRRELQLQQATNFGLVSAFAKLVERDGAASLFAGLIPSTLQVLPSAALSYFFYEMMKSILKIGFDLFIHLLRIHAPQQSEICMHHYLSSVRSPITYSTLSIKYCFIPN